ncbi:branched-chain amino acid ABC transporter permease [Salinarchaeum sp. Harcht-Bsk1]|uniref:branched-chain amino acid ABC transporter permease n=1 Tax=Salinarchaeum sp. Harcht-Bsk1 TaxID=1333523 RepID=UPI0003422E36|nr:branched-chain amino acid ABC transporter permease [Salinarchaeum sp. Harcht-Bsk1]AGN01308.1 branched-chain amino acid ABC transporter permease [Salinarchaeum sp. Harcht-Bsk1]
MSGDDTSGDGGREEIREDGGGDAGAGTAETGATRGGLRGRAAPYADGIRSRMTAMPRWKADAVVVLTTLALVYVLFVVLSWGQGLDANGTANTLARLTFLAAAYALLVLALNLHWGYAGLFNIGVAGFMSVAVFTLAIVSGGEGVGFGLPIWAGMIAGMLAAAALGAIAALPALRLRADYFAIVTLGIAEIVRFLMKSQWLAQHHVFGNEIGLQGSAPVQVPSAQEYVYKLFTVDGSPRSDPTYLGTQFFVIGEWFGLERTTVMAWGYAVFVALFVVFAYLLLSRIAYSPFGRILKAIREDEGAAQALGKPTSRIKIYSFVLGCAIMGLAGMLWQASRFTVGADAFVPILTFYVFVALIVGGSGSNAGSIVGGIAFVGLLLQGPRMLQRVISEHTDVSSTDTIYEAVTAFASFDVMPFVGYAIGNIDLLQRLFVGLVLIVLMLRRPDGILGHRKEIAAATDLSRPAEGRGSGSAATAGGGGDE